jgi:hypothetical protein
MAFPAANCLTISKDIYLTYLTAKPCRKVPAIGKNRKKAFRGRGATKLDPDKKAPNKGREKLISPGWHWYLPHAINCAR